MILVIKINEMWSKILKKVSNADKQKTDNQK